MDGCGRPGDTGPGGAVQLRRIADRLNRITSCREISSYGPPNYRIFKDLESLGWHR